MLAAFIANWSRSSTWVSVAGVKHDAVQRGLCHLIEPRAFEQAVLVAGVERQALSDAAAS